MSKTEKRKFGDYGEDKASLFLTDAGYKIVKKNYQKRGGEIDIIAWHPKELHGETLCFVEVKTRKKPDGSAERATGREKIKRLLNTAKLFCIENKIDMDTTPIQFEQVSVYQNGSEINFKHFVIPID